MRKRILSLLACVVVLAFGGFAAAQMSGASAATTPNFGPGYVKGALVKIDPASPRGEYVDANGIHHCLPQGPNALTDGVQSTGDYPAMWFALADPACDFGASAKPAKVTAPSGDASAVKIVHKTIVLNANSPATQTLTISGLPAYKPTLLSTYGSNADANPSGTTVAVAPLAPASGSTERSFTVAASGFTGSQSLTLDVWVLVVAP